MATPIKVDWSKVHNLQQFEEVADHLHPIILTTAEEEKRKQMENLSDAALDTAFRKASETFDLSSMEVILTELERRQRVTQ